MSRPVDELRRVRLPQGTVTYVERAPASSDLPPVVFVHGFLVDSSLWSKVANLLAAQGVRTIAPNWPLGSHTVPVGPAMDFTPRGFADLINGFLDSLGLDDVTLVGSDTGGALCQFTIDRDHSRIGRLVLTNCDAFEFYPPAGFGAVAKLGGHPLFFAP